MKERMGEGKRPPEEREPRNAGPWFEHDHEWQRTAMQRRISELLDQRIGTLELAELLNAQAFVHSTPSRHDLLTFDVKGFVEHTLQSGSYLQLPEHWTESSDVILPPGEGEIRRGNSTGIEKKSFPRTRYLLEVLSELGLNCSDGGVGKVEPGMVRQQPYFWFWIHDRNLLVLV